MLAVVGEVSERKIPESAGAIDTRNYLRARLTLSPETAGEQARLAAAFAGPRRDTGAALAEGRICLEQALAIIDTVNKLPERATAGDRAFAARLFLGKPDRLDAKG